MGHGPVAYLSGPGASARLNLARQGLEDILRGTALHVLLLITFALPLADGGPAKPWEHGGACRRHKITGLVAQQQAKVRSIDHHKSAPASRKFAR